MSGPSHINVPVSRRLSATGIRFSVILFPPGSWALLTVGLPDLGPDPDGVSTFRTHELRPGWVPPIPRGRRCSPDRLRVLQSAPALSSDQSLPPLQRPICGVSDDEASSGVHSRSPVRSSPLPVTPGWNESPWASPPSFTPRRYRRRMSKWGRALSTDPELRCRHQVGPPIR